MNVLITNDDGISAAGLDALVKTAVARGHRVLVSAPATQQSAVSQHLSLNRPLFAHPVRQWEGAEAWAVEGTPAETATATETAAPGDIEALKVENAILREKIEKMEAQVEKLRKALQELI